MAALTPAQLANIRRGIAALRKALDDFERALSPDGSPTTPRPIAAELEEFIEKNVPEDEVERLSELVPELSEIQKEHHQQRHRDSTPQPRKK